MTMNPFDIKKIRADFPVLKTVYHGKPLVYLDNAATTQKPIQVIKRTSDFYTQEYATVHRAVYHLSQIATAECDQVRKKCQKFLNARSASEIIFTSGATEAINLVASAYGRKFLKKGDSILVSAMEHHANLVPWQQLALEKDLKLQIIPMDLKGELLMDEYRRLLKSKPKLVAMTHVSNALGTVNPVKEIVKLAHEHDVVILVDGAQAVAHQTVDVQDIDCDFYCFSAHKIYGPTGVGVLYGKSRLLEMMEPYQTGGDMIESVTFEKTTFAKLPNKFEAGTPNIAGIVGLGPALDYLTQLSFDKIGAYEEDLLAYGQAKLSELPGFRIIGQAKKKAAVISFELGDIHPHDVGTILDEEGIAVRTGHHCAQPVMDFFKVPATVRASFAFYNTREEIDLLFDALKKVQSIFQ